MKILLTNDDGVRAEGINLLFDILSPYYDVYIVAPLKPRNAISHAITLKNKIKVKKIGKKVYGVDGTPTDAVTVAFYDIVGKPDLLISGINAGPNLGEDVTYSGTVGAAMEGTILGIKSCAMSYTEFDAKEMLIPRDFILEFVKKYLKMGLPEGVFLNVNIPPEPKGIKITRLGNREYQDVLRKVGRNCYEIRGVPVHQKEKGTDIEAIMEGYISITPLKIDLTAEEMINKLKDLKEINF